MPASKRFERLSFPLKQDYSDTDFSAHDGDRHCKAAFPGEFNSPALQSLSADSFIPFYMKTFPLRIFYIFFDRLFRRHEGELSGTLVKQIDCAAGDLHMSVYQVDNTIQERIKILGVMK